MFIVGMNVVIIGLEWKVFSGLISFHPNSASIVSDRGQFKFSSIMATLRPHTASPSFHEPRWIGQGWDPLHGPDLIPSCSCTLTLSYLLTGGPALGPILRPPTLPYPTLPYPPHPMPPLPSPPPLGHHHQLLVFYGFPSSINQRPSSLLLARVHHAKAYKLQLGARQWSITTRGNHSKLACGLGGDLLGLLPPIKAYLLDLIAPLHPNPC
jgi:hypothetical protein